MNRPVQPNTPVGVHFLGSDPEGSSFGEEGWTLVTPSPWEGIDTNATFSRGKYQFRDHGQFAISPWADLKRLEHHDLVRWVGAHRFTFTIQ